MSGGIVLVGLSGSGKSTVGRLLEDALRLPLRDTDRQIEAASGRTIADIFRNDGEAAFRQLESEAVLAACAGACVVSVGGGAVLRPENRQAMRRGNLVVWLDPPLFVLASRLAGHQRDEVRPLLQGDVLDRLKSLAEARRALYAAAAHLRVSEPIPGRYGSQQMARAIAGYYRNWQARERNAE